MLAPACAYSFFRTLCRMAVSRMLLGAAVLSVLGALGGCAGSGSDSEAQGEQQMQMDIAHGKTLNIAHRGARSLAPENTIAAAAKGLEAGADLWELDVQLTADKKLIVLHDDTLSRTSDAETVYPHRSPWNVADFTLEEIRKLDFGSWFNENDPFDQIAAGAVSKADQRAYEGIHAPTLREALEWTRTNEWAVNVELKNVEGRAGEEKFPERVAALVQELDMTEEVLVSTFNHEYLRRVKREDPRISTGVLTARGIDDPVEYVRSLNAAAYNPSADAVAPSHIKEIRAAGVAVYVYTVNEKDELAHFIDAGVSGLITDFPQRLAHMLAGSEK